MTKQKVLKKRIATRVVERKVPVLYKLFGGLGNTNNVGEYVLFDILVPALRDTIVDAFKNGVDMLVHGEPTRNNIRREKGRSYVSYASYYEKNRERDDRRTKSFRFDDLLIADKWEAEEILSNLVDLIEDYGVATVYELHEMMGVENYYVEQRWGWDNIGTARVEKVRGGYLLALPRPKPIND